MSESENLNTCLIRNVVDTSCPWLCIRTSSQCIHASLVGYDPSLTECLSRSDLNWVPILLHVAITCLHDIAKRSYYLSQHQALETNHKRCTACHSQIELAITTTNASQRATQSRPTMKKNPGPKKRITSSTLIQIRCSECMHRTL